MPTYEYSCDSCNYTFEAFHGMLDDPLVECPNCSKHKLIKLISGGGAVIIKGTSTPCRGGRSVIKNKKNVVCKKSKSKIPFWRNGPINKNILKNPEKYIHNGEVD